MVGQTASPFRVLHTATICLSAPLINVNIDIFFLTIQFAYFQKKHMDLCQDSKCECNAHFADQIYGVYIHMLLHIFTSKI